MNLQQRRNAQKNELSIFGSITLIAVILIAILAGRIYLAYGRVVDTQSIIVKEIKVEDNRLELKGNTTKRTLSLVSHKYKIKEGDLFLKLRFALGAKKQRGSNFEAAFEENDLREIEKVYLQGKQKDDLKLIWER
jgi:hypothetical protein